MKRKFERHNRIVDLLKERRSVEINELSEMLRVSPMTIRRDLNELTRDGLLLRTHGGALLEKKDYEPPFVIRSFYKRQEKIAIGKMAAHRVENGDVIALDIGSTCLEVARQLDERVEGTVLTNFIPIALVLSRKRNLRVFLLGGLLRKEELSLVGDSAIDTIRSFRIDKFFLGISGLSPNGELMDYDPAEAAVKKVFMESAKQIILVADHTKFFRSAPTLLGPVSCIHEVITDSGIQIEQAHKIVQQGVPVTQASLDPHPIADTSTVFKEITRFL